jgi:hypothetical protein
MPARKKQMPSAAAGDFDSLVTSIVHLHQQSQAFVRKAVNVSLTLRNWLIGRQIELYERQGTDRAIYGDKLMDTLATRLKKQGWDRCDRRELYRFRQFFITYPRIVETVSPQSLFSAEIQPLMALLPQFSQPIRETVTPELLAGFGTEALRASPKRQSVTAESQIVEALSASPDSDPYRDLLDDLSAAIAPLQKLHQQAVEIHVPAVREILLSGSRDAHLIEHTLDHLLDHACIPQGLALFKSLCPGLQPFCWIQQMVRQSISKPLEIERLKVIPTLYPQP